MFTSYPRRITDRCLVMNESLMSHATAVLDSTLPGSPEVSAVEIDTVLRNGPATLGALDVENRGRLVAALIWARIRAGFVNDAVELSRAFLHRHELVPGISDRTMEELLVVSACAYVARGWTQQATPLALRARDYACHRQDSAAIFRAHGVLAFSRALNGEYALARDSIDVCNQLREDAGWPRSVADYLLLVSQTLCSVAAFDSAELRDLAHQMRGITPSEPLWELTARLTDAMGMLIDNDANRALPLVMSVVNGGDKYSIFEIARGFAVGMNADLLLGQGEARRVLTLLEPHTSPPTHVLCFAMQRAAAHLLLGNDRQALIATDPCIRLGAEHCMRTLPPVLLRRAVAHERLEQREFADDSFEQAFHMVTESGSAIPLITLPRPELIALLDRLVVRRPEFQPQIAALRTRLDEVPVPDDPRVRLPTLTGREELLAGYLRSDDSFPAIASQLHVSVATVRSQAQSVYSKLGVNSRSEAVEVLERAAFYT